MKTSTLVSGIVGGIVLWILGFLFYGLMDGTGSYTTAEGAAVMRGEDMSMLWLVIGHLIVGIAAAMLFHKWTRGTYSWRMGMEFGLTLGLVLAVGMSAIWFAVSNSMSGMGHVVDGIFNLVAYAIMGITIALVMGAMEKSAE